MNCVLGGLIWKIEDSEFFVVLFCGFIVCLCGVDFVAEITDLLSPSINDDCGSPFFGLPVIPDASVLRGGVDLGIAGVPGVVGGSGGAEVGLAIVPAVMIDVVHIKVVRHINDFAVHRYCQPLFQYRRPLAPYGVVRTVSLAGVPFVSAQPVVVVGVHDGVFALREGDSAERIAVPQLSVPEQRQHGRPFQPARYSDFDNELDDFPRPPRCAECRILNYELRIVAFVDGPVRI
jgi:hypothetical protein